MEEGQALGRDTITGFLDRAIWWSLVAMIVAIPLAETPKTICFISALVFWLVKMVVVHDFRVKVPRLGWFLLAWLGATALSTFNSECGFKGVADVFMYVSFFLLIVNVVDSERKIIQLFWAVVIGIGIGDVVGLWITTSDAMSTQPQLDRLRILSLGMTAAYLALVLSFMMGMAYHVRWGKKEWFIIGLVALLSITALILTYARSLWIILLLVVIIFVVLQRSWWPVIAAAVLIVGLGLGLATSPVIRDRANELTKLQHDASFVSRFGVWNGALAMVQDHPLVGIGAKCFMASRKKYQLPDGPLDLRQAHNQALNVVAETGIIGLATFLAWLGYYTGFLFKLAWATKSSLAKALWFSAIGSLVTILLHGMVETSFGSEVALLFMLIAGCLIVAQDIGSTREEGVIKSVARVQ
jgi:O-antigen ligase